MSPLYLLIWLELCLKQLPVLNVKKDIIKISLCSSNLIYLPSVDIALGRDVLTEILLNVSTLEHPIDAPTSWFDNLSRKDKKSILIDPNFVPLYNSAIVQSFS